MASGVVSDKHINIPAAKRDNVHAPWEGQGLEMATYQFKSGFAIRQFWLQSCKDLLFLEPFIFQNCK